MDLLNTLSTVTDVSQAIQIVRNYVAAPQFTSAVAQLLAALQTVGQTVSNASTAFRALIEGGGGTDGTDGVGTTGGGGGDTTPPQPPAPSPYSVRGFYGPSTIADGSFIVYFTEQTQLQISKGWVITGLPGITGNVVVQIYNSNVYSDVVINPGPPAISFPYVSNAIVFSDAPNAINVPSSIVRFNVTPGNFDTTKIVGATTNFGLYDPKLYDPAGITGQEAALRELNSNVSTSEGLNTITTVVDRGAGLGALISMAAIGAQEPYVFGGQSHWIPHIDQHTPFSVSQRLTNPVVVAGTILGSSVQIPIAIRECRDLISDIFLQCTIPSLPSGKVYCETIGRALLSKVELIIDGVPYELLTDDWYIIHDQFFLDADEKNTNYKSFNAGFPENQSISISDPKQLIIPLNFFFCRSKTGSNRPYLPTCALANSSMIVRIEFNTASWITDATVDENGKIIDITNVRLIIEEITLGPAERIYFMNTRHVFRIPQVWREAVQQFRDGQVRVNFTPSFPISMMAWFIRKKSYENDVSSVAPYRYTLGYTTNFIRASTPVTFFNGTTLNFIDVIQSATLYINNNNVLSNFPGALYYSYKQPIDHGLSIPTKNIYMYSFSKNPKMLEGGLDFAKLNTSTSHLDITFSPEYASEITASYNLHMYYYGYRTIEINNGRMAYVV